MAVLSVFLSFSQEYRAGKEAEKLSEMVRATSTVFRNGKQREVKIKEIVPGDIIDLYAGDIIPADIRIISCKDLFINQASLTGESFPIEKIAESITTKNSSIMDLKNIALWDPALRADRAGTCYKNGIINTIWRAIPAIGSNENRYEFR